MRHQSDLGDLLDTDREEAPVSKNILVLGRELSLEGLFFTECGQICIHGSETQGIQDYLLSLRLNFAAEN